MFIGEFQHSIDEKGRVAVPAKFRRQISGGAIITKGLDYRCLFVLPKKDWDNFVKRFSASPTISQANSRAFARYMFSGASDVELDTQGRVLIPDNLRAFARLKKSAMVICVYNRIEIWDLADWQRYKAKIEESSEEIAEKMADLGI